MAKVILEIETQGEEEIKELTRATKDLNSEINKTEKDAKKASGQLEEVGNNGGAIATLDRLTGGLASQIRDAYEASKLFNISLRATRGALIATGIGAFVVALGVVVAYWEDIQRLVTGVNNDLKDQRELIDDNIKSLNAELSILEAQEKIRIAQGESVDDIVEKRKGLIKSLILENQLKLANLITDRQALAETIAGRQELAGILALTNLGGLIGPTGQQTDQLKQLKEDATAAELAILSLAEQLAVLNRPEEAPEAAETGRDDVSGVGIEDALAEQINKAKFAQMEKDAFKIDSELATTAVLLDNARFEADQKAIIARENAAALEAIEAARLEASLSATAGALGAIGQLVGEQTAAGKTLGIAQATIDTYVGANKALAQGGFLGIAMATTVIATGLANIQKIASTQVPGVASSGGSIPSGGGSLAPQIPQANFNVVGDSGIDTLADSISDQQNQPVRAYITQQDITTNAQMERETRNSSTV